ncbi:hypothetical protein LSUE1_G002777 [Lachnellula suecica]|uniref:Uncharacterized protein n=1 Tax=Lachnellula suecica TaxID=602035 RepID=A0A8T9CDT3_9HELO|nr:hypothetical protein LSUE1_G002777 [Lachnellula suecica]
MPPKRPFSFNFNAKTVTAPLAAFTMATILFIYARTSIQAAKRNAQKHREADGGQINWHNENLRRHGRLEAPESQGTVGQILGVVKDSREAAEEKGGGETEAERKLRERTGKGRGA